ncbi:hypothetical protein HdyHp2_050 [Haloarcula virus Hardyhisp2]|uniref:Uncharacterized protein n=1 Tax=Haloarcula virus Hardyhisp2 TaxID=2811386 RepID=A0A898K9N5_9VIRU|nr:hypothetical protein QIT44_gp10 [Haloarcula virus Hardyhisp2]QSJ05030.1 hypothetical protein HdyHp2_050 [Haloarcula virus Hardyhisp2]
MKKVTIVILKASLAPLYMATCLINPA